MKKIISLILVMCIMLTINVFAYESNTVYTPTDSCKLIDIQFTQFDNPWLLWDVTFDSNENGTVLTTTKDHPNLIGCTAQPNITFMGNALTFNGIDLLTNTTVTLNESNELIISDADGNKARYIINITEDSRGLPAVLIDTDDVPIVTKLEYIDANISVLGAGIYNGKDIYSQPAEIKLRGNTTMMFDKKPYRIKFNKKQDVLGMGSAKSWVLLAGYLDPSVIRNQTAFLFAQDLYEHTAKNSTYLNSTQLTGTSEKYQVFSPRMKMVEVYLNGEFKGLYDMGDHMQANEIRVAIDESGDDFEKDELGNEYQVHPEGNVGYFIEFETGQRVIEEGAPDSEDWSAYSYITNVGAAPIDPNEPDGFLQTYIGKDGTVRKDISTLYFQFKLPEVPSDEQIVYITEYLQEFNDKLLSDNLYTKESALQMIDVDSFIDWYLINELFKNPDSQMQSSCYFYKDKDDVLYMAPVWDFDISSGGISAGDMSNPSGWRTRNDEYCGWFRELFEIESFKNKVVNRWAELHECGIINNIFSNIEHFRTTAKDAAKADRNMWHESHAETISNSWMAGTEVTQNADWDIQLDYFSTFLKNRIKWMDEQQFETEINDEPIKQTVDSKTSLLPQQQFSANIFFGSQTFDINKHIPNDLNNLCFSIQSPVNFNISLNMDISYTHGQNAYGANTYTEQATATIKDDWSAEKSYSGILNNFSKTISSGTYTDMPLPLENFINENYTKKQKYVSDIFLKSITIEYTSAPRETQITFSLDAANMIDTDNDGILDYFVPVEKIMLSGAPAILGSAVPGNTLIASPMGVYPKNATYMYQWYRNDMPIPGENGSTYAVTEWDADSTITVKIIGTMMYSGTLTSKALAVKLPEASNVTVTPQKIAEVIVPPTPAIDINRQEDDYFHSIRKLYE